MKNLILAIITIILAGGCAQQSLPLSSGYKDNNYSFQRPNEYATVLANPAYNATIYYRDANGKLIQEQNNFYPTISDTSGANYRVYYRMNERCKKFPQNIIKEKMYGDNYSNGSHQRMSSTLDSK